MGEENSVICRSCKRKVTTDTTGSALDPDLYDAFRYALKGPILTVELDYIDCSDEKVHFEFQNFNPDKSLELLIKQAVENQTSPDIFYKEMKELITLKRENDCGKSKREIIEGKMCVHVWYSRFRTLLLKYGIVEGNNEPKPESVTLSRLPFMFPHLHLPLLNDQLPHHHSCILPMYQYPEFGGIIPSAGKLPLLVRKDILTLHLHCMHLFGNPNSSIAFRTHHLLINQRIKAGLLSNERRIRFLINNDVITLDKKITPMTEKALQSVREEDEKFEDKIMWDLLDCI